MDTLRYSLSLATGGFVGDAGRALNSVTTFKRGMSSLIAPLAQVAGVVGGTALIVDTFRDSITKAANMESLETSFRALLKSGTAAKAMVKDLTEFADVTPFDPVPVAAAGKQLLAFGYAAKTVKPLLGDIGDLAAAMEKPLEEVATVFGRLKSGDFGEAFERLRDFGISRQDLEGQGLKFDRSGSFKGSAEQAVEGVRRVIRTKFGGGMQELAGTFKGIFSTFQGYWDALQRSFGRPIMQSLKPFLEDGTKILQSWTPIAEEWGKKVGSAILVLRDLVSSDQLGDALGVGLKLAGALLVNQLNAGFQGMINGLTVGVVQAATVLQDMLANSSLWNGVRVFFLSIGDDFKAMLYEATAEILKALPFNAGGKIDDLKELATLSRGQAGIRREVAGREMLSADLPNLVRQIADAARNTQGAFVAGYQGASELIPTGPLLDGFNSIINPLMQNANAFFAKQNGQASAATEAAKQTASNTRASIQILEGIVGNLQLISDKIGSQDAAGNFA